MHFHSHGRRLFTGFIKHGIGNSLAVRNVCKVDQLFPGSRGYSVKVGDVIPSVDVHETTPASTVNTQEFCSGRKVLIFAVPGAFTPGCSKTHLPGYIANYQNLKEKGIEEIACVAVNDAFVMSAWGQALGATDKIRMLADTTGEFTKALGAEQDLAVLGGLRSKRYSMIVDHGKVITLNMEPDGKGLSCSLAENALKQI